MEEINLKDLFNYFLNKKLIIIIMTIVLTVVGFVYGYYIKTPLYKADTSIILVTEGNESKLTNSDIQLNQSLVSTYSEIIKSRKILNQVIKDLDLSYTYEELNKNVTVTSTNDTSIITINVTDSNKNNSYKIANKIAEVFVKVIPEYFDISNVNVLDKAIKSNNPYNINYIKDIVIFMLIGLILSCGYIFILFYFDRSITSIEQIEHIGMPILGKVHMGGVEDNDKRTNNK